MRTSPAVPSPLRGAISTKPQPAALLLASILVLPAAVRAQETAPAPDPADTLRAVEMAAVERRPSFADRAEVARMVEARYPPALRRAGLGGTVVVRLVIDAHGRPVAPRVAEASGNEDLDAAAVRVVEELRYVPASRGGAPHPVWVNLPVTFLPPDADRVAGATAEQVRAWADSAGALAPSQVDERAEPRDALETVRTLDAAYPAPLREAGVGGTATVWFVIGKRGTPGAARVTSSAGHPELDRAALAAVGKLRFRPARRGGQPVDAWMALPIPFEPPTVAADTPGPDAFGAYEMSEVETLPDLLDRARVGRAMAQAYPHRLRDQGVSGEVSINFLIDERGEPRHVTVGSSSDSSFAAAALSVVQQMRFRPATLGGRPVPVWTTLPIVFDVERERKEEAPWPPPLPGEPRRPAEVNQPMRNPRWP